MMKLSDVKIVRSGKDIAPTGRVITVSFKGVRVLTAEDRVRMEETAKRHNDKRKYPVMHEA